ncbi:MAG: alkaline phosphatase family protein [Bacteroidia bacterium]
MATCIKWVNTIVITCTDWAESLDNICTTWADEGSNQCSTWADAGSNQCSAWSEQHCHWYSPWNCIAGWFCQAYFWVSKWVCLIWLWISKWVCKAFAWIIVSTCSSLGFLLKQTCIAWNFMICGLKSIANTVGEIFSVRKEALPKIEHVFVLMLENRSYDHVFGFSNITGLDSITGEPKTANGVDALIHSNIDPNGTEVFVNTPADYSLRDIDIDPGHNFGRTLTELCGMDAQYPDPVTGDYPEINNSGFIKTYGNLGSGTPGRIMNCFSKEQLPVLNKLAEEFAVCDNWFSSLPGPTSCNRFFLLAATSGGLEANPKPDYLTIEEIIAGIQGGFKFENGHIFDELDSACIDWAIFAGDKFPNCILMDGMIDEQTHKGIGRIYDMDVFKTRVSNPELKEKFIFIEPKYDGNSEWDPRTHDYICGNSMHPLDDVTRGEKLVKEVYETIRNSPHWGTSALIIAFDEHGGFYDHVKPPKTVPPGDIETFSDDGVNFKFNQLGVRVPAIIVSPLIKKGVIDSVTYDHTSVLATIERLFGLDHLTERDKNANDFLHLFSLAEARTDTPATLPDIPLSGFDCGEKNETEESLLLLRAELIAAQKDGYFRKERMKDLTVTDTELGLAWMALIKIMQQSTYKEKLIWASEFKNIKTNLDAVKFKTEAILKLEYSIDCRSPANSKTKLI